MPIIFLYYNRRIKWLELSISDISKRPSILDDLDDIVKIVNKQMRLRDYLSLLKIQKFLKNLLKRLNIDNG